MSPMVDGWMGDDWFHFGAFRQANLDYFTGQTTVKGAGEDDRHAQGYDDYENFRRAGSAGDFAQGRGPRSAAVLAQDRRASRLRRVLAAAGARQDDGRAAAEGADDVDSGTVGPGGHVGRDPQLSRGRAQGHRQRQELSGDGPVAPQRRELRRRVARPAASGTATPRCNSAATC